MGIARVTEVSSKTRNAAGKEESFLYFWNGVGWCRISARPPLNLEARCDLGKMGRSCGGVLDHLQLSEDDARNIIREYGLLRFWGENFMEVLRVSPERLERRAVELEVQRTKPQP